MANGEKIVADTATIYPGVGAGVVGDIFAPVRDSFAALQAGERLPYELHEATIAQTIEDEIVRFTQTPNQRAAQLRYEAALTAMRSIPAPKAFIKELDATLYREALKVLADTKVPEPTKAAIVKASMNIGIGGGESPAIIGVPDKLIRLQKEYRETQDVQKRAAMEDYLLLVTGDPGKVSKFFKSAGDNLGNARRLPKGGVITAAGLAGVISLTLAASPAAAQDRSGPSAGSEQPIISISATSGPQKQTIPSVEVAVDVAPVTVPAGTTITAQADPNQLPVPPTVNVTVPPSPSTAPKNVPTIPAQTSQNPVETPQVNVSPAGTESNTSTDTQPKAAPTIPAQITPTTPAAPEVVPVTPSTSAPATPSSPNTPATPDAANGSSAPATPDVANSPNTPATPDTPPVIQVQTPDTSVTPKDGETPAATIARVIQGHDATKAVYVIRTNYGSAGNHQAAPNVQLASTVDAYVADTQAKILAANHGDSTYTNNAITALAYLDAVVNDPTILDTSRTVAKDAQTAIAAFATTGEPYHDKLLAQEVTAAKQNLSTDAAGKFAGISEADQTSIAQLAGYASLATKTDAEQNTEIQKIKDDEAAAAKAAADKAAADAAAKAAADKAAAEAAAGITVEKGVGDAGIVIDVSRAGETKWTTEQLQLIQANLDVYLEAEKETGVPWEFMAVLHARETGLHLYNPKNGQGVYQMYSLGTQFAPSDSISHDEFLRQTLLAAHAIADDYAKRGVVSGPLSIDNPDKIKDTFFSYNGRANAYVKQAASLGFNPSTQPYEGSPYVMNLADDKRNSAINPNWGQILTDGGKLGKANQAPGAWVLFDGLVKISSTYDQRFAAAKKAADAAAAQKAADAAAEALKSGDVRQTLADGLQIATNLKAEYGGVSGKLKPSELASQPGLTKDGAPYTVQLNPEAMKGYIALAAAFKAHFGYDIRLTYSYRTLAEQESLAHSEPSLAAKPGTSNHGWGLAIDLASNINNANSEQSAWMRANAYKYGWVHPTWAHDGTPKGGADEPWHWEFLGSQATFDVSQ